MKHRAIVNAVLVALIVPGAASGTEFGSNPVTPSTQISFDQGVGMPSDFEAWKANFAQTLLSQTIEMRKAASENPGDVVLESLNKSGSQLLAIFNDTGFGSHSYHGSRTIIQTILRLEGAAGPRRVEREIDLPAASSYTVDFGNFSANDKISIEYRFKRVPRPDPRGTVRLAHDYTVCNGPQCFSCTHTKVEKCDQKDVKICIGIVDGKPHCSWETTFINCRLVDGGHTCVAR